MQRCKYAISYGANAARFSNEADARLFGRTVSTGGFLVEMRDKTGLVGQWQDGAATAEFAHTEDQ